MGFISCKSKKENNWPSTVFYYDTTPLKIISPLSPIDHERYFLISYIVRLKNHEDKQDIEGDVWFSCDGFPKKHDMDSIVFDGLEYKKGCYQNVIVTSIFEFKNREDYLAFGYGTKADIKKVRHKSCDVKPKEDTGIKLYYYIPQFIDTAITKQLHSTPL